MQRISFAVLALALFALIAALLIKTKRRTGGYSRPGPGAAGAIYDMLNQDKRNAIELIVENRAEERTLEHEDDIVGEDNEPPKLFRTDR